MLATPADQVRAEIRRVYAPAPLPAVLQPFIDDPPAAVAALAELVRAYWERALAPHWPRIRALLEGDVLHRARQLADGGAQRLFGDIHPELRFADDTLFIDMPFDGHLDLGGRGLLFVPSAFTWPRPAAAIEEPWQPFVVYPARGIASLWEPGRAAPPAALAALLGRRRAPCSPRSAPRARPPSSAARSSSRRAASPSICRCCATPASSTPTASGAWSSTPARRPATPSCKSPEGAHRPRPRRLAPSAHPLRRRVPRGDPRGRATSPLRPPTTPSRGRSGACGWPAAGSGSCRSTRRASSPGPARGSRCCAEGSRPSPTARRRAASPGRRWAGASRTSRAAT